MSEQTKAEAEVRQAFLAMMNAYNAMDADTFVDHWHPEVTYFFLGGVLSEGFDKAGMKAWFDAGNKPTVWVHQVAVKICGDAALVTCYLASTFRHSDSAIERGTWRYSEMLVRQDGAWLGLHCHWSLLTAEHSITKP